MFVICITSMHPEWRALCTPVVPSSLSAEFNPALRHKCCLVWMWLTRPMFLLHWRQTTMTANVDNCLSSTNDEDVNYKRSAPQWRNVYVVECCATAIAIANCWSHLQLLVSRFGRSCSFFFSFPMTIKHRIHLIGFARFHLVTVFTFNR